MRNELGGTPEGNTTPELNNYDHHDSSEDDDCKMSGIEDANHNVLEDKHMDENDNDNVRLINNVVSNIEEVKSPDEQAELDILAAAGLFEPEEPLERIEEETNQYSLTFGKKDTVISDSMIL